MTRRRVLSGLAGAAALISAVTVVSRLLGFLRNLVFSNAVGAASVGDAYNAANTLPNVLFEVAAGGALAGALIPVLAAPLARGLREDVSRIASAMLTWTLGGLTLLAVVLAALAAALAGLLVDDPGAQRDLVAFFIRVFAVQVPLYGLAVVLSGVLQAQRRFFWPAFAPVLSSLVVIATYAGYGMVLRDAGLAATLAAGALPAGAAALLAWGTTAGVAAMGLPLLIPVVRSGVRLRPSLHFPPGVAVRARNLALAGIGGLVAQQASVLVVMLLSYRYGTDGTLVAWQSMVQPVYFLPYAVLAVPLATSTFPRLAERASRPGRAGYAPLAAVTTRAVLATCAAGAAVLVAVAPAVTTVFQTVGRGEAELLGSLTDALTLTAPGLLGYGLVFHVSRALYALERGRLAVIAVSVGWGTVIVASLVACWVMVPDGLDGPATLRALAIGSSVGMLVGGAALLAALRRSAGPAATAGLARTLVVLVAGAAVGSVAGRFLVDLLDGTGLARAVLAALVGAVVAGAIVVALVAVGDRGTLTGLLRRGVGADEPGADEPGADEAGAEDDGRGAARAPRGTDGE